MKRIFMKGLILLALLVSMSSFSFANIENFERPNESVNFILSDLLQDTNAISASIMKGDASGVAKYFDSRLDIQILDQQGTFSKAQAEQMLKTFFTKNKVTNFKVIHSVGSADGSSSSIVGRLDAGGKTYRMYMVFSVSGTNHAIQELSIKNN